MERSSTDSHFFQLKTEQTRKIGHAIIYLFLITMRSFDYNARNRSKKRKVKAEVCEKHLLLIVDRHFNLAEGASSSKTVMRENAVEGAPLKKYS